jgi:hypothetical protein
MRACHRPLAEKIRLDRGPGDGQVAGEPGRVEGVRQRLGAEPGQAGHGLVGPGLDHGQGAEPAHVPEDQLAAVVQGDPGPGIRVGDPEMEHPGHPEVQHQLQPLVEGAEQELAPPAHRLHGPPQQPVGGVEAPLGVGPEGHHPPAGQLRLELPADRLDLG